MINPTNMTDIQLITWIAKTFNSIKTSEVGTRQRDLVLRMDELISECQNRNIWNIICNGAGWDASATGWDFSA